MIAVTRLARVNLWVRILERSLEYYRRHFGFEPIYEVSGGGVVSRTGRGGDGPFPGG